MARTTTNRTGSTDPADAIDGATQRRRVARGAAPDGAALLFVAGSGWAAIAMAAWALVLAGRIAPPGPLAALDWHVHALLYGFAPAIVVGYLMTIVPNRSGRLPVAGPRRVALLLVWLAGRLALTFMPTRFVALAGAIDAVFLGVAFALVAREAIAGRDRRTGFLLLPLGALAVGNGAFLWQAAAGLAPATGMPARLGVAALVLLVVRIGGGLVPSFTRRWFADIGASPPAAASPALDAIALATAAAALLAWTVAPSSIPTGALLVVAGCVHALRWLRWHGWRTLGEPLVWALHAGYAFVPLGFLLLGAAALGPEATAIAVDWPRHGDAIHAWSAGAVGTAMLAVMCRVALRRARREARASAAVAAMLVAVVVAGLVRTFAGVETAVALWVAAAAWTVGFGGFAIIFGAALSAPPPARRAG